MRTLGRNLASASVALVLALSGCTDGSDRSATASNADTTKAPTASTSTSLPSGPQADRGCTSPPPESSDPEWRALDHVALRSTDSYTRLPTPERGAVATALLEEDLVVLEVSGSSESVPVGDSEQYETVVLDAELWLRRIGLDGTTRWVTSLGTPTGFEADATPQMLRVTDEAVHIVWPRFDGAMPARYPDYERFTLVQSAVGFDGGVIGNVDLEQGEIDPSRSGGLWTGSFALDAAGAAIVSELRGDGFHVRKHQADGSIEWSATAQAGFEAKLLLAAIDGNVAVASSGLVLLLDEHGHEQWRVSATPQELAAIRDVELTPGERETILLLAVSNETQPWLCVLDLNGEQRAAVDLGSNGIWDVIRAWPIEGGLLLYAQMPAVGVAHGLYVLDFATQGRPVELILSGSGYDDEPQPGSGTGGIERLADGALVMIGYEEDWPARGPEGDEFERRDFLLRLPPTAGNGDLDELPLLGDS